MTIAVTCEECGKVLKVADSMAGKKGKCPQCKSVLSVPQIEAEGDIEDAAVESGSVSRSKACPNCDKEMSDDEVFCVECGTNVVTGEKIEGV